MLAVGVSYRQTIRAYPHGGGSYIVASDNLGRIPGLVAAAGLMTDYILTVAVSVASGVAAITSAIPSLASDAVADRAGCDRSAAGREPARRAPGGRAVRRADLRVHRRDVRARRSSASATPRGADFHPDADAAADRDRGRERAARAAGIRLGVDRDDRHRGDLQRGARVQARRVAQRAHDADVDGLPADRCCSPARSRSSTSTGSSPTRHETVLSQLAHRSFGAGAMYAFTQAATAAILLLAANTAYNDFPRVLFLLARDYQAPRLFLRIGDRLSLQQRDHRCCRLAAGADLRRLRRQDRTADPAVRRRRVPRLHAVPGGHGRALVASARRQLAAEPVLQRHRRRALGDRVHHRRDHEVHRRAPGWLLLAVGLFVLARAAASAATTPRRRSGRRCIPTRSRCPARRSRRARRRAGPSRGTALRRRRRAGGFEIEESPRGDPPPDGRADRVARPAEHARARLRGLAAAAGARAAHQPHASRRPNASAATGTPGAITCRSRSWSPPTGRSSRRWSTTSSRCTRQRPDLTLTVILPEIVVRHGVAADPPQPDRVRGCAGRCGRCRRSSSRPSPSTSAGSRARGPDRSPPGRERQDRGSRT